MKKKNTSVQICLCSHCASIFYNSSKHRISRSDPLQVITDECLFCRCCRGYDYNLEPVPNIKTFLGRYAR